MTYTVDSSVWIAALLREDPTHDQAYAFVERLLDGEDEVVLPVTIYIEVVLAIARRTLSPDLPGRATEFLLGLPAIEFVEIDYPRMISTVEKTMSARLRGMDAIVLHVTQEFDATLVTLDSELQQRAQFLVPVHLF